MCVLSQIQFTVITRQLKRKTFSVNKPFQSQSLKLKFVEFISKIQAILISTFAQKISESCPFFRKIKISSISNQILVHYFPIAVLQTDMDNKFL